MLQVLVHTSSFLDLLVIQKRISRLILLESQAKKPVFNDKHLKPTTSYDATFVDLIFLVDGLLLFIILQYSLLRVQRFNIYKKSFSCIGGHISLPPPHSFLAIASD